MRKVVSNHFQARFLRQVILLTLSLLMVTITSAAFADSYEVGLKLYAKGDYAMASRYFLEATGHSLDNPNAHYYLADSYLRMNRLAEAQAEYQKILAIAPNTQAARLAKIGLAQLRDYLSSSQSERWRKAGGSGPGDAPDKYMGGPINGEDYLDEVTEGGRYVRWSLSKMPLKIYIESSPIGIRNFQPAFISQVRRALDVWTAALGHQLSFMPVSSPDQADIRVTWTNTIDTQGHNQDGGTAYTAGLMIPHIRNDQIDYMEVKLATFDIKGKPQSSDIIYAVAIHELGHSLGLMGHSSNPADIMYAENQHVIQPSRRDLNTLQRLYSMNADINNLSPNTREEDPNRETELARKLDESLAKMEAQASSDDMALSWLNLGVAYYQKGKTVANSDGSGTNPWYEKALGATNKAIQKEPKDPRAYHKRSLIYQEMGNYGSALQDIQQSISLDRREAEYYKLQSWFYAKLGQMGQARSSLDTYLIYKPGEANSSEVKQIQDELAKGK